MLRQEFSFLVNSVGGPWNRTESMAQSPGVTLGMAFSSPTSPPKTTSSHHEGNWGTSSQDHHAAAAGLSPSCSDEVYKQALSEHAYELGIDLDEDTWASWIVQESLVAPLTDGWTQIKQEDGEFAGNILRIDDPCLAPCSSLPGD